MSWAIDVVGTKSDVVKRVTETLDKIAAGYDGKEEGKDIVAVKGRILSIIEAMDVSEDGAPPPEQKEPRAPFGKPSSREHGIYVKANGSHAWSGNGIVVANLEMRIGRTTLPR